MSQAAPAAMPGSVVWLALHDARLGTRRLGDILAGLKPAWRPVAIATAVLIAHAAAWPIALWVAAAAADPARAGLVQGGIAAILAFVASWMLAQALMTVTRALYVRGDLDLLLSAPLSSERIVSARAVGMVSEGLASGGVFLLPIANMLALQGDIRWLGLYPVLLAMALAMSSVGLALALGLFRLVGPKRARTIAQMLAMVIGAVVALGIQALAVLPKDLRTALLQSLDLSPAGAAGHAPAPQWLPIAAVQGEPSAILLMLAPAAILFLAAVRLLGPAFVGSVLTSAGSDLSTPSRAAQSSEVRFAASWREGLRRKEIALITRDPWILGQMVLQIVYTLPIALILARSGIGAAIPAVAVTPALVIIAAQVSGALAWIAISGEDAPEFMATAPVSRTAVEWTKLEVIAMMVGVLLAVPVGLLALSDPLAALIALACCVAAGASCALVNLWHPTDGRRRAFMRRHQQSKLISLFEHGLLLLWAITGAVAQIGLLVAIAPAVLALALLGLARRVLGRSRRDRPRAQPAAEPATAVAAAEAA